MAGNGQLGLDFVAILGSLIQFCGVSLFTHARKTTQAGMWGRVGLHFCHRVSQESGPPGAAVGISTREA